MCVGFWSLTHPKYALILCATRDEQLARPTLPAHFHSFEALSTAAAASSNDGGADRTNGDNVKGRGKGSVLSGRDVQAEGTWLGLSQLTGRVALLTNITEASAAHALSRGTLAASFLADPRGDSDLERATAALTSNDAAAVAAASYAGFNLLLLEPLPGTAATTTTPMLGYDARLLTNGGGGGRVRARKLSPAEYAYGGISNGVDGEGGDAWPKVIQGRAELRNILELEEVEDEVEGSEHQGTSGGPEIADEDSRLTERLIELLTARTPDPLPRERAELRDTILVPPFKESGAPGEPGVFYGTRLAQVILIRRDGRVKYVERDVWRLDGAGNPVRASAADMRSFVFRLGSD